MDNTRPFSPRKGKTTQFGTSGPWGPRPCQIHAAVTPRRRTPNANAISRLQQDTTLSRLKSFPSRVNTGPTCFLLLRSVVRGKQLCSFFILLHMSASSLILSSPPKRLSPPLHRGDLSSSFLLISYVILIWFCHCMLPLFPLSIYFYFYFILNLFLYFPSLHFLYTSATCFYTCLAFYKYMINIF